MLTNTAGEVEDYKYLDSPDFKAAYTSADSPLRMNFYIEGVHCSGCLGALEGIATQSDAIDSVSLNMSTNIAQVIFARPDSYSTFPELVSDLGYKAHPVKSDADTKDFKNTENKKSLYRMGIAGVCAGNIMLLSAAIYSGAEGIFKQYFETLNFFLSIPVITYCTYPFYKNAYSAIKARRTTVDYPVVFVVLAGFILSSYNLIKGLEGIYFDSVSIFIFLLLTSRYFIRSIQQKIVKENDLLGTFVKDNKILKFFKDTHEYKLYPVSGLRAGDEIRLNKGQTVPVDGTLLSRSAVFDLSVLTGESIPKTMLKRSDVYAGAVLDSDSADLKVVDTGTDTRLGKILDSVKRSYEQKISFEGFSDKYSTVFTSFVAFTSLAGFLAISNLYGTSEAFKRIVSFILIACPCAFVFILPLTLGLSLKSAVKKRFIVKDSSVFEKMKSIKNIIFDKTGTLTKGKFDIVVWDKRNLLQKDLSAVLAIESKSHHPVARAIVNNLGIENLCQPHVENLKTIHSKGISAEVDGHIYEIYADKQTPNVYHSISAVSNCVSIFKDGEKISTIYLGDEIKNDALATVNQLIKDNFDIYMLSGDRRNNVELVSDMLSIAKENSYSGLTPEHKIDFVKSKRNSIFIGDGLNDAGALLNADIGIAVQGSAEQSLKVSDIYLLKNNLSSILRILEHGKVTNKTIKTNTIISMVYNLSAGTLALLGFINPLAAAVLMPLSSVILLASSLIGMSEIQIGGVKHP